MSSHTLDLNRALRRKRLWRMLRFAALGLFSIVTIYAVYFSHIFALTSVEVQGNKFAATHVIVDSSGLELGTPLARIDAAAIAQNIEMVPEILSVEVRRVWPNEVILAVTERVPVAMTQTLEGWQFVDETGVIFGNAASLDSRFTQISGADARSLGEITRSLRNMPQWLTEQVQKIDAQTPDSVTITLTDGTEILWGNASLSDQKAEVLRLLMQETDANLFDVSAPSVPVVKTR